MKVKIIKSECELYWYSDEIGNVYDVNHHDEKNYCLAKRPSHLILKNDCEEIKELRQNTLEIYPYRGGFRYRKIAANGKVLNHHYNTVAGAKKGAEAERKFWENFKIVVKK